MMFAHAPEFGIVLQQIREFAALLHQMNLRQPVDLFQKPGDAEHLAQHQPRIVKAQRLVEIADQQVLLQTWFFVL